MMFKFNELRRIHLEITNNCQASCPMCRRNINGGGNNPLIQINNWTLENFKDIISFEVLENLEGINFCGNFGDPLLNNDLIEMVEYVVATNPHVSIHIHTNGSLRNTAWWTRLAKALPTRHVVVFAIDGLKDTHGIHRIGTDYEQIIHNASSFIQAGGIAEWAFIRFKHNAHQVKQAQELSAELGFKNFVVKNSKRFSRPFPVVDKDGQFLYNIEQPEDTPIEFVGKSQVAGHQQWRNADKINCQSLKDKELYIDAHYLLSPCCMIGAFLYTNYDSKLLKQYNLYEEDSVVEEGALVQEQVLALPKLNVLELGLKQLVETDMWQTMWQKKWNEKSSSTCIIMCGPNSPYISIDEQKIIENVR